MCGHVSYDDVHLLPRWRKVPTSDELPELLFIKFKWCSCCSLSLLDNQFPSE